MKYLYSVVQTATRRLDVILQYCINTPPQIYLFCTMTIINYEEVFVMKIIRISEIHLELLLVLEVHKVTSRSVVLILYHGEV